MSLSTLTEAGDSLERRTEGSVADSINRLLHALLLRRPGVRIFALAYLRPTDLGAP